MHACFIEINNTRGLFRALVNWCNTKHNMFDKVCEFINAAKSFKHHMKSVRTSTKDNVKSKLVWILKFYVKL